MREVDLVLSHSFVHPHTQTRAHAGARLARITHARALEAAGNRQVVVALGRAAPLSDAINAEIDP